MHAVLDERGLEYDARPGRVGGRPFLTPEGSLSAALAEAIDDVTGVTPELSTTGGTSDGRFISTICPQTIEFGPVNATIHKIDERVAVADIEPLKDVYRATLDRAARRALNGDRSGAVVRTDGLDALVTVRDVLRHAVGRFSAARLFFGHGSADAYDEAVYLVLHRAAPAARPARPVPRRAPDGRRARRPPAR